VVIISGCSSGIGAAAARAFRGAGWTTVATARRLETLDDLRERGCEVATLDVTDAASREAVAADVLARHGRIDALVNNAGYAEYGALEEVPLDRWRAEFETNVFGLVALTQLVLPTMRAAARGRIINVSSMGGIITLPLGAAYHSSKFAVEALSDVARLELAPFGIRVVVIEPGVVLTNFGAPAQSGLNLDDASPYASISQSFSRLLAGTYSGPSRTSVSADRVASTIVRAASSSRPRARYRVGAQATALVIAKRALPARVYDALVRAQVR
jgi:NAD(P)-dependent dehydrogenase (short-subunit alcohol dehydrogenase family)